jgi:tRNA-splicing ligase RtcB
MSPTQEAPKLLNWASDLDPNALDQAKRTAALPFVSRLALMPDAHYGMGATIGSVIATRGAIIPAAVGVDIGCGLIVAELPFTVDMLPDDLDKLHGWIAQVVPSGVGKGHEGTSDVAFPPGHEDVLTDRMKVTAGAQMGSLGSGNHFIEICADERDRAWVMLHSGSRGVGKQLADIHIAEAKGLMARYFIELEDADLAYLVEGTESFDAYIRAMLWAQDYALANRETMMDAVLRQIAGFIGYEFEVSRRIQCHHNFTAMENHGGKNSWITRKGAIRARTGDWGVIPGSMGTRSYIVTGLGSEASLHSCSHGAGRRMSRGQARRELDLPSFEKSMEGKAWNSGSAAELLDEDPRAYKDVERVMADQEDLVQVEHTLTQILNYKGV